MIRFSWFDRCALFLCAGLNLLPLPAAAQEGTARPALPARVLAALSLAGVPAEHAAFVVQPLDGNGGLRVAVRDGQPFNPASTMKLVTTYVALQQLGPAYRWHTEALVTASPSGDVLNGPLWLRGSGDPSLVVERFWLLVQQLRSAGLRELRGDLVLDRSAYAPSVAGAGLIDGNDLRPYNVAPDALLVNYNAVTLHFIPDPDHHRARIVTIPPLAGFHIPATVRGIDGPCGDWESRLAADFRDHWAPAFGGVFPLNCGEQDWNLSLLSPADYVGAVFRYLWESSGGKWRGTLRDGPAPAGAQTIAAIESPPLAEVIREINKFSNNVMARQVFLTLGAEADQAPASTVRGANAVRSWLGAHGLAMPELQLDNGSGLSRDERISAGSLARLLVQAWHSPWQPEFTASLPIAGIDGTMRHRHAATGSAHVKTGYLADARAIAGYVHSASGRDYVVVGLINDPHAPAAQAVHDALLQWIYDEG